LADYNKDFYQYQMAGSLRSAEIIIPMVLDLVAAKSVIDIGCGVGTWLSVYQKLGVSNIAGVDGSYVDRNLLLIDNEHFEAHDLSKPLITGKTYDLVQSLEVAEHIAPSCAAQFISDLTKLGNIILFSAAVPFQLGTGHVNEQYINYWTELFARHDYLPVDAIRPKVWDNESVEVCYRQNILLFVRSDIPPDNPGITTARLGTRIQQLSIIHPDLYQPRIHRLLGTLIDTAKTVLSNGNLPLAQSILNSITDFAPQNDLAWDLLGQIAAQGGRNELAISHLKRAIDINPVDANHHFNLGQVYANANLASKALEQYRLAQEIRPGEQAIQTAIDLLSN